MPQFALQATEPGKATKDIVRQLPCSPLHYTLWIRRVAAYACLKLNCSPVAAEGAQRAAGKTLLLPLVP